MPGSYTIEHINGDTSETYNTQELKSFTVVDQGDFEIGTSPMLSEGFYNCIAIIGLSKCTALLGHFQRLDSPSSNSKFRDAIRALTNIEAHTIYLGAGGMFDNPNDVEVATEDRSIAEKAIRTALPASNIVIDWNDEYNGRQDISIFPESGKIVIHNATSTFSTQQKL